MWISFGEGFLLVFAINDKESFRLIRGKYDRIIKAKHGNSTVPILLVGNKLDLAKERTVTFDEAKQFATSLGIEYMETSAKDNINCKEAFENLAQKIIDSKKSIPKPNPCPCCNII